MPARVWLSVVIVVAMMLTGCGSESSTPVQAPWQGPGAETGRPCGDERGANGELLLDADVAAGIAFDLKHPDGFAEHGCVVVDEADGHPVRGGSRALRFEVRDGDCNANPGFDDCANDRSRHELTEVGSSVGNGEEVWYAWSLFFTEYPVVAGDAIVFLGQFNTDAAARFYIEDMATGLGYRYNDRDYAILEREVVVARDQVSRRWIDVLVHATWSAGDQGRLVLYVDGTQAAVLEGPNMDGASTVTFDLGIYNAFVSQCGCDAMPTQVVYVDEIRRGPSRAAVEPRPAA